MSDSNLANGSLTRANVNSDSNHEDIDLDGVDEICSSNSLWIPYDNRPEWSDITPIPSFDTLEDAPAIVKIAHTPEFEQIYSYLRAIIAKSEISERAFALTQDAVTANPANYSAWYYRRQIIKQLNLDLMVELDFISYVIINNPKNYQVWEHRRLIVEWSNNKDKEHDFLQDIFEQDDKNYHAWQYLQWLVRHFNMCDTDELDFCTSMISRDIRNNSAWNHRFFLFQEGITKTELGETVKITLSNPEVKQSEINFTIDKLRICMNNESAWNYLRGLVDEDRYSKYTEIVSFCQSEYDGNCREIFLLEMILEIWAESIARQAINDRITNRQLIDKFEETAKLLTQLDPIRTQYWSYFIKTLRKTFDDELYFLNDSI